MPECWFEHQILVYIGRLGTRWNLEIVQDVLYAIMTLRFPIRRYIKSGKWSVDSANITIVILAFRASARLYYAGTQQRCESKIVLKIQ